MEVTQFMEGPIILSMWILIIYNEVCLEEKRSSLYSNNSMKANSNIFDGIYFYQVILVTLLAHLKLINSNYYLNLFKSKFSLIFLFIFFFLWEKVEQCYFINGL